MKRVRNSLPTSPKDGHGEPRPTLIIVERFLWGPPDCACDDAIRDLEQGSYDPDSSSAMVNDSLIEIYAAEVDDEEWRAQGHGQIISRRCRTCSAKYSAILEAIPVHLGRFECPKCGSSESISYKVDRLDCSNVFEFDFEVRIVCDKCRKKKTLSTVLKNILKVVRIEVGPSGVTVKNA